MPWSPFHVHLARTSVIRLPSKLNAALTLRGIVGLYKLSQLNKMIELLWS
jgi:hypothetical protein